MTNPTILTHYCNIWFGGIWRLAAWLFELKLLDQKRKVSLASCQVAIGAGFPDLLAHSHLNLNRNLVPTYDRFCWQSVIKIWLFLLWNFFNFELCSTASGNGEIPIQGLNYNITWLKNFVHLAFLEGKI